MIGKLAEYIGRDPVETILICKKETDKENAGLWENWCARRESNPRPSASETKTKGFLVTLLYNINRFYQPHLAM